MAHESEQSWSVEERMRGGEEPSVGKLQVEKFAQGDFNDARLLDTPACSITGNSQENYF